MKSFLIDMKSVVKSYFFLSLITFLILLVIFSAKYFSYRENDIKNYRESLYRKMAVRSMLDKLTDTENDTGTANRYTMNAFGDASRNYTDKNHREFNLNMARFYLGTWEMYTELSEEWNSLSVRERNVSPQEYYGENWDYVKKSLDYPTFSAIEKVNTDMTDTDVQVMQTTYYYELFKRDLEEQFSYSTGPWAIIYNLNRKWVSKIIVIVSLLLGASIYSKQLEDGIIKTKLSIGVNRKRYLFNSLLMSVTSAVLIFIIPLIFIFIIKSLKYGLKGYDFPVLMDKFVVSYFRADKMLPSAAVNIQKLNTIGLSTYVGIGPMQSLLHRVVYVPLWQNILLSLGITLLSIVFWSSLGLIIAIFFKGPFKSISIALGFYLITYLPALLNENLTGTIFDLPGLTNSVNIIQGFQQVTLLQILLLYLGGGMLLLWFALTKFKRLDILK